MPMLSPRSGLLRAAGASSPIEPSAAAYVYRGKYSTADATSTTSASIDIGTASADRFVSLRDGLRMTKRVAQ